MPTAALYRSTLASLAALLVGSALPAHGQWGGTLAVQSDARERGISYSPHQPRAQLTLAYDGSAGWYGGGLLTHMRFDARRGSNLVRLYLGRVTALTAGLDLEAGLQYSHYPSVPGYDFGEPYIGLLGDRWNARLHYARSYYGSGQRAFYDEINLHWPLRPALLAVVHGGVLAGEHAGCEYARSRTRADARVGLVWQAQPLELQLSWSGVSTGGPGPCLNPGHRQAAVLGVSASF